MRVLQVVNVLVGVRHLGERAKAAVGAHQQRTVARIVEPEHGLAEVRVVDIRQFLAGFEGAEQAVEALVPLKRRDRLGGRELFADRGSDLRARDEAGGRALAGFELPDRDDRALDLRKACCEVVVGGGGGSRHHHCGARLGRCDGGGCRLGRRCARVATRGGE